VTEFSTGAPSGSSTAPPPDVPGPARPPAPASALDPWPDEVTWRPVSRKQIAVELLRFGFGLLFLLVVVLVADAFGWPYTGPTLAVLGGYALLRGIAVVRAVLAWGYAERERDLLVRHGLLVRRLSIVPYARMQFVDVTAGPLERAFGLATVQLHTAAAASDARIPGLPPAEASRLRDRLAALGEDLGEGL
jgi:membrane protein YdbS with pleckstrin-like domain